MNGIKLKYNGHYIGFLIALIFSKACDIPLLEKQPELL